MKDLPETYFREAKHRVYVNRDLRLDKIQFLGFDMDYTLAVYKEPEFETLSFDTAVKELVAIGYPAGIVQLKYDPAYPIRGLIFDQELGNFLKVDQFGHIAVCYHGKVRVKKADLAIIYPSLMINPADHRFYSIDTLYSVCEAGLFAQLIDYLENNQKEIDVSFHNLFNDVRLTVDTIHRNGMLKKPVMDNPGKYIHDAPRLRSLLERVRASGMKTFLLTNSDFIYSNCVMTFLLGESWKSLFDYVIVSAAKPKFFQEGSQLREVDLETGNLHIGKEPKELVQGCVYNGGSIALFQRLTGAKGDKVLYVGDHIFSDVVVSKQRHFWRTLLVVRELEHEIRVNAMQKELRVHLANLEFIRREAYRGMNLESAEPAPSGDIHKAIKTTQAKLDAMHNAYWGSLFRSGTKHSYFSLQVERFADLYTSSYEMLANYPVSYVFIATAERLPHEEALQ